MIFANSSGLRPVLMSKWICGKRLRTSIPCAASESLKRTRNVSAMWLSDAPCQACLNGGDACADLNVCADLLRPHLESAHRDQRVERTHMTHVSDTHQLALHLILPALDRHAQAVAQELDQFAAIETLGHQDAGDARSGIVWRQQLQPQRNGSVASRIRHQRVTCINPCQTF